LQEALQYTVSVELAGKGQIRRSAILEAAQKVFAEKGFELATMQDVSAACNMSAGNLYRYFPSKAAIVSGLVERDRHEMAARFAELAVSPNQLESFELLGRGHLKGECARDARLTLEIWAAASRRPELREVCTGIEQAVLANLDTFLTRVKAEGMMAEGVDPATISHLIMVFVHALFRDAALRPDHDIEHDLDVMFATVRAALAGHIKLPTKNNNQPQTAAAAE
jgi:TetR/AcrR family transcriptional regulator, repressor for uid operon